MFIVYMVTPTFCARRVFFWKRALSRLQCTFFENFSHVVVGNSIAYFAHRGDERVDVFDERIFEIFVIFAFVLFVFNASRSFSFFKKFVNRVDVLRLLRT